MNKRSFLRGFGVGVLFAAVILGISFTVRTSDSYVMSKAKELGMVYGDDNGDSGIRLAMSTPSASADATQTPDITGNPDDKANKDKDSKSTQKPESTANAAPTPAASTTAPKTNTDKANKTSEPDPKKEIEKEKEKAKKEMEAEKKRAEREFKKEKTKMTKNLTVDVGDWSSDVSRKLQSLGIVKDAKDFDKYLNDNGFSSSISAGTYQVSVGDTYNELARKITKR